jgi:hypothetical protein
MVRGGASVKRAINILDYVAVIERRPDIRILLQPHITDEQVRTEHTLDGFALRLCEMSDDQFGAILQIIRQGIGVHAGIHKSQLRIYEHNKGWKRV